MRLKLGKRYNTRSHGTVTVTDVEPATEIFTAKTDDGGGGVQFYTIAGLHLHSTGWDIVSEVTSEVTAETATSTPLAPRNRFPMDAHGYDSLAEQLHKAYVQASGGKGKERHANGEPFDQQLIMRLGRTHGIGFLTGQASKKLQEAVGMLERGQRDAAQREMHGAMVYSAAAAHLCGEAVRVRPDK